MAHGGATLSLLYAQKYPDRVKGMILRGVFLGRKKDYDWSYQEGANRLFPDYWQDFIFPIPEEERSNILEAYYNRLKAEDELARTNVAKRWAQWEAQCASLDPSKLVIERLTNLHTAMSLSLIETHYFMNHSFIKENQIINEAFKLKNIPGIIIHGRFDVICTIDSAYLLQQSWLGSELQIIRNAGHAASEPGITDALVNAAEMMISKLRA